MAGDSALTPTAEISQLQQCNQSQSQPLGSDLGKE